MVYFIISKPRSQARSKNVFTQAILTTNSPRLDFSFFMVYNSEDYYVVLCSDAYK